MGRSLTRVRPHLSYVALGALVAFGLAAPILLFGAFTRQTVEDAVASRLKTERERTVQLAAELVRQELRSADQDLVQLTTRADFREALRRGDRATLQDAISQLRSGQVTLLTVQQYGSLGVIDARGTLLARDPSSEPADPAFIASVFARTAGANGQVVSPTLASDTAARRAIAELPISRSVKEAGETLGVVYALVRSQRFGPSLDRVTTAGRELVVLDAASTVAAGSSGGGGGLLAGGRTPGIAFALPALDRALSGEMGTLSARIAGADQVVTYGAVEPGRLAIYLLDAPSITLEAERRLSSDLDLGVRVAAVVAVALAAGLALLFALLRRHQAALEASRAELARVNVELANASKAKSDFLARMSHELRTPLNAIIGFSDLLAEGVAGELNARQRDYAGDIASSGRHLLSVINDILDLSRVEAGRMEFHPEDIDLKALAEEVHAAVRPLAAEKRLRLELDASADLPVVRHDPRRLRQVLLNLLSNAVKFTPEGGAVTTRLAAPDRDRVEVAVSDTGIGIATKDQAQVFEEFRRVESGYARAQQGTGIGLALVKRFVEAMGGSIALASEVGKGSTFTVRLPLAQPVSG